jgi:hypothetical protein
VYCNYENLQNELENQIYIVDSLNSSSPSQSLVYLDTTSPDQPLTKMLTLNVLNNTYVLLGALHDDVKSTTELFIYLYNPDDTSESYPFGTFELFQTLDSEFFGDTLDLQDFSVAGEDLFILNRKNELYWVVFNRQSEEFIVQKSLSLPYSLEKNQLAIDTIFTPPYISLVVAVEDQLLTYSLERTLEAIEYKTSYKLPIIIDNRVKIS